MIRNFSLGFYFLTWVGDSYILDLVSCWFGMYMLELNLFCGKDEALDWLEKLVNTKEVPLKICPQGTLGSFRKSVIS